jgi:hypothetical protein
MWNFIIPAAIGAFTSAAMGKNPIQGAVLGGATGGLLGGMEGNLFNLGSNAATTAGTSAATSGATAFGASQAPSSLLASGVGSGATSGGAANFMQPTMPYQAGLDYPAQLSATAMQTGSPVVGTGGNIGANMNYVNNTFDPSASQNLMTSTRAYQQGGLAGGQVEQTESSFSKAYENLKKYATDNPLVAAQLGLAAFGGINPPQREIQDTGGQITKGTPPQGVGTPLRVRRPR